MLFLTTPKNSLKPTQKPNQVACSFTPRLAQKTKVPVLYIYTLFYTLFP